MSAKTVSRRTFTVVVFVLAIALAAAVAVAALRGLVTNNGNQVTAASAPGLTLDDSGQAIYDLSNVEQADGMYFACVTVTADQDLTENIRVYMTADNSGGLADQSIVGVYPKDPAPFTQGTTTLGPCGAASVSAGANTFTGNLATFLSTHPAYASGWDSGVSLLTGESQTFGFTFEIDPGATQAAYEGKSLANWTITFEAAGS